MRYEIIDAAQGFLVGEANTMSDAIKVYNTASGIQEYMVFCDGQEITDMIQAVEMEGEINMKRVWYDIEEQELVTEEQLMEEYKSEEREVTFEQYIYNCLTCCGGTLEKMPA